MPILYFVARPGQTGVQGIYRWTDNGRFAGSDRYLLGGCYADQDRRDSFDDTQHETAFYRLITRSGDRPYRQDSFIIIAPGIDRQWFTGDDNRNFGK